MDSNRELVIRVRMPQDDSVAIYIDGLSEFNAVELVAIGRFLGAHFDAITLQNMNVQSAPSHRHSVDITPELISPMVPLNKQPRRKKNGN